MNKTELIEEIAGEAGLTKTDAKKALEAFMNVTEKTLKKEDKITLVGFGTFSISERSARTGRNPRTGEVLNIKAKKVVKFKPGSELSKNVE